MRRFALVAAALGLALVAPASGAPVDGFASQLAAERSALAAARAQAAEAEARAAQLDREAQGLRNAAARDRAALTLVAARIQASEAGLAAIASEVAVVDRLLAGQRARLAAQQRPLAEQLAALQLLARRPPLTLFAEPGTATDIVHQRALIEAILPVIRARTANLRAEIDRSRRLAATRRAVLVRQEAANARLVEQRRELARREAESRRQAASAGVNAGMEGDRAVALAEDAGDIGALVARLEDAALVRDRLARLPGPVARPGSMAGDGGPLSTTPASPASPPYMLPVVGRIERGFGDIGSDGTRSRGLTLVAPGGAQVVAPARGRVVFAGPFRSFGRIAIIDHGGGWTSLVTGMIAVSARVGDTVDQGAPLGRAGPGQPRIAVELRRAGRPIDVAALLS